MEELKIKTPAEFAEEIEDLVWKYDIDYIDAVVLYCEQNDIEVETVASLVKGNANLKSRMQNDAESLNFLPKVSRLPV